MSILIRRRYSSRSLVHIFPLLPPFLPPSEFERFEICDFFTLAQIGLEGWKKYHSTREKTFALRFEGGTKMKKWIEIWKLVLIVKCATNCLRKYKRCCKKVNINMAPVGNYNFRAHRVRHTEHSGDILVPTQEVRTLLNWLWCKFI